jgi:exodeoxyribonuclease III
MAFRKKASPILSLDPDIVIIPECECVDKLKFPVETKKPTSSLWFGNNLNKGLGIFSYNGDIKLKVRKTHNPALRTIVPISVTGKQYQFTLYAIWAHNPDDPDGFYVEQIWKAIHHYEKHLVNKPSMLIGDFNSNTIWDRPRRKGNHSNVVKFLEKKKIYSSYHSYYQQTQGKEEHPTLYMYRHKDKPYHIDYCFISKDLLENLHSVEVGDFDTWTTLSDHVPVIVTLK